jgi:hypothetical protein
MGDDSIHCSKSEAARPPDATHRVLRAIYFELALLPEEPPSKSSALIVWLNRDGTAQNRGGTHNGRPRPPKRRAVDLRIGDELLCGGRWAKITGARAFSSAWLTFAEAAEYSGDGYVYRVRELVD